MQDFEEVMSLLAERLSGNVSMDEPVKEPDGKVIERGFTIPLGVSNHHIHLAKRESDLLFGEGYEFHVLKALSQPGQYASQETVTLAGPKGVIEGVRILGPLRSQTQVELSVADCFKLGVKAPVRLSGDLKGTPGITIIGPKGSVQTDSGVIVSQRHIHMLPSDAQYYGVKDHQIVSLEIEGERGGVLENVIIRETQTSKLECHLDMEEANAMGVSGSNKLRIIAE